MMEKHKRIGYAALSCAIVALLVTCAFIPMVMEDTTEATTEPVTYDDTALSWTDVRQTLAIIPYYYSDVWAGIGDWISGTKSSSPSDTGEYARATESINTLNNVILVSRLASQLVDNDRQTWTLAESYLNRASEIGAASTWYEGATFDADDILDYAGLLELISTGNFNTQYALDSAYDAAGNQMTDWAADDQLSSIQMRIIWNGGNTAYATSGLYLDFCTIVTASSGQNLIYLDTSSLDETGMDTATNHTIYNFGSAGTITSTLAGSSPISLASGANSITELGLTSGWYTLSSGVYGGPFMSSVSSTAATNNGGVVIVCDSTIGYVTTTSTGVSIVYGGATYASTYLRYQTLADSVSTDTSTTTDGGDVVAKMVKTYANYYAELKTRLFSSADAAQVMWNISSSAHSGNILLSPSSIIPQLTNLDIDVNQSYSLYVAALDQISSYYENNEELLKASEATISVESLKLYCYGTLYNADGTVLAANVIFTPYVYVRDMTISTTGYNVFDQSAMVMVWDTAASSLSGWENTGTERTVVLMEKGTYFTASSIMYNNNAVDSVDLEVKKIVTTGAFGDDYIEPVPVPDGKDTSWILKLAIIELGAIIALLGIFPLHRSEFVIIIGVIVIALGFFASDLIYNLVI